MYIYILLLPFSEKINKPSSLYKLLVDYYYDTINIGRLLRDYDSSATGVSACHSSCKKVKRSLDTEILYGVGFT